MAILAVRSCDPFGVTMNRCDYFIAKEESLRYMGSVGTETGGSSNSHNSTFVGPRLIRTMLIFFVKSHILYLLSERVLKH